MAEAIILPLAKTLLDKLVSFPVDLVLENVTEEIKAAKSVEKDVKSIYDNLIAICAVLRDADAKQYASQAIKVWLRDLKSVVYELDDFLDEVAYDALLRTVNKGHFRPKLRYYLSPSSNPLISRFHLSHKIKDLRERLASVVAKKNAFGLTEHPVEAPVVERDLFNDCSYVNKSAIVGREQAKIEVINRMLAHGNVVECPYVLPLVGMGGIGKTTLAKLVYDDLGGEQFDLKLWACVSDTFNKTKLLEDIIKDASGAVISNLTLGQLVQKLQSLLNGNKYFLVLDDIWLEDRFKWIELKSIFEVGNVGSVILITTRSAQVASHTVIIILDENHHILGLGGQVSNACLVNSDSGPKVLWLHCITIQS
ncbi:hypothetical protein BVRB_6g141050 [Beta vulgaris subsp. vulgaris]|nr:hypothetical protein BVRB_6g141050 [Beta vulgaris subsp. vulgaris]